MNNLFRVGWIGALSLGLLLTACGGGSSPAAESNARAADPSAVENEREVAESDPIPEPIVATKPLLPTPTTPVGVDAQTVDPAKYDEYEIITLLPQDAIPAINNPTFLSAAEANEYYDADELVIGVTFNGDARAYSVPHLSTHEIVNDTVGGEKIAVTW